MINVYLDTNVYIGAKYIFDRYKLNTIKNLAVSGKVTVLQTSATAGEVKQHIKDDIGAAVKKYKRVLRVDMPVLNGDSLYQLVDIDENQAINHVIAKMDEFLNIYGVQQISLNPLNAEKLLDDYFKQIHPFESKKPNEFKDAIIINAIRQFQLTTTQQISIVSSDAGFRKAFSDDCNFKVFEFLSGFLMYYNQCEAELVCISDFIAKNIDDGDFDDTIKEYLLDFEIDRGYYEEWNCESFEIDEINCELLYIEEIDRKYLANVSAELELSIDITYRDEETSFYDKEENAYLFENFIHATERHRVTISITVLCDIEKHDDKIVLNDFYCDEDIHHRYINLDENTLFYTDEIENTFNEEPDLVYCIECGSLLGHAHGGVCFDRNGNPICSNCAVSNDKGDICPKCGRKVPHEYMMSGFCKECEPETN